MPSELKPCHKCKSSKVELDYKDTAWSQPGQIGGQLAFVRCLNCGARSSYSLTEEGAVAAWNRRAETEGKETK